MRTARLLTVSRSIRLGDVVCPTSLEADPPPMQTSPPEADPPVADPPGCRPPPDADLPDADPHPLVNRMAQNGIQHGIKFVSKYLELGDSNSKLSLTQEIMLSSPVIDRSTDRLHLNLTVLPVESPLIGRLIS